MPVRCFGASALTSRRRRAWSLLSRGGIRRQRVAARDSSMIAGSLMASFAPYVEGIGDLVPRNDSKSSLRGSLLVTPAERLG